MATILRFAKSGSELNDVLELRYRAMLEAGRKMGHHSRFTQKLMDHFDIFPSTYNVVAYNGGRAVACLRGVEYKSNDPVNNFCFDFKETASTLVGNSYYFDMLAIIAELSNHRALQMQTLKLAMSALVYRGIENALFVCPVGLAGVAKELQFRPIADMYFCEPLSTQVVPMTAKVGEFYKVMLANIKDQELLRFQEAFYYSIFDPGEVLVVEGERGSTAYLIEEGEVEVVIKSGENLLPISTMTSGQMIGEVAMVTNEPRTASLIAKTTTTCLSFDRADFMKLMYEQPHRSLDMFKIFSKRLNESNRRLAEMRK